jgi:hypothetical protein
MLFSMVSPQELSVLSFFPSTEEYRADEGRCEEESIDVGCGPNHTQKGHWMPGSLQSEESSEDITLTW